MGERRERWEKEKREREFKKKRRQQVQDARNRIRLSNKSWDELKMEAKKKWQK